MKGAIFLLTLWQLKLSIYSSISDKWLVIAIYYKDENVEMNHYKDKNETNMNYKKRKKFLAQVGFNPVSQNCLAVKRMTGNPLCDTVSLFSSTYIWIQHCFVLLCCIFNILIYSMFIFTTFTSLLFNKPNLEKKKFCYLNLRKTFLHFTVKSKTPWYYYNNLVNINVINGMK